MTLAIGTGIFLLQYSILFLMVCFIVALWVLWFLCRRSYEVTFKHHLTVTSKGISWRYLGISGFASWDIVEAFNTDNERGWLNLTFATSDHRHASISLPASRWHIPIRAKNTFGIRLNQEAHLQKSWLSNLPKCSRDVIPLSLVISIPQNRDGSIKWHQFQQTEFGQILYDHAPHLFEDVEKPKKH